MENSKSDLISLFKSINDPRDKSGKRHLLEDILTITILGVLCGAEDWSAIEMYGRSQKVFLKTILKLPHGIPSDDTFRRLFIRIDYREFETIFIQWTSQLPKILGVQMIHIDGKTLRHSFDGRSDIAALHLVSAWSSSNNMVLGQLKSEGKSNEIKTIPKLLKLLDIQGAIITIDAMGCQKKIATEIIQQGADYILAVKENQGELYEQVTHAFNAQKSHDTNEQLEKGHGRIETRTSEVINDLLWIDEKENWCGLQSIIKIQSQREINGIISREYRYYISSLKEKAKVFNIAIRKHWSIENNLHWVLDMAFREDDCRKRSGNESENFAIIRRVAINLLKRDPNKRLGIKNKRLKAALNRDYLLSLFNLRE